jgi:hypothetical protein
MESELITPESAYVEALRAAGPVGDDLQAWFSQVDEIASGILSRAKSFIKTATSVSSRITLVGEVIEVQENPVSEGGRKLNLYRVAFKADAGTRPDLMWLDKTKPGDVAMFKRAQELVGQRARIVKEQRVQFKGDEPDLDNDGKPITRPYLAGIEAEGGPMAAPEDTTEPASVESATVPIRNAALSADMPTSASEVVRLAQSRFDMPPEDVQKIVTRVIGPKPEGGRRPAGAYGAAWRAIEVLVLAEQQFGLPKHKTVGEAKKIIGRNPTGGDFLTAEEWETAWRVICETHQHDVAA